MCIKYNECHYGGMYNVYVKRIFVITEIMHMNEKTGTCVSTEKEKVKESQSRSVTLLLDTPFRCRVGGVTRLYHPASFDIHNVPLHFDQNQKI